MEKEFNISLTVEAEDEDECKKVFLEIEQNLASSLASDERVVRFGKLG